MTPYTCYICGDPAENLYLPKHSQDDETMRADQDVNLCREHAMLMIHVVLEWIEDNRIAAQEVEYVENGRTTS